MAEKKDTGSLVTALKALDCLSLNFFISEKQMNPIWSLLILPVFAVKLILTTTTPRLFYPSYPDWFFFITLTTADIFIDICLPLECKLHENSDFSWSRTVPGTQYIFIMKLHYLFLLLLYVSPIITHHTCNHTRNSYLPHHSYIQEVSLSLCTISCQRVIGQ